MSGVRVAIKIIDRSDDAFEEREVDEQMDPQVLLIA